MGIANCVNCANFSCMPQDMRSHIGTAQNIAHVFRKHFFTAIRKDEPSLDDDLGHSCN